MKDVVKIRIAVKPETEEKDFGYYYDSENTFLYSVCFLVQNKKKIKPYDTDARFENEIYYLDFYFKMHPYSKPPKLSFGLHIFENGQEVRAKINVITVKVFSKTGDKTFENNAFLEP